MGNKAFLVFYFNYYHLTLCFNGFLLQNVHFARQNGHFYPHYGHFALQNGNSVWDSVCFGLLSVFFSINSYVLAKQKMRCTGNWLLKPKVLFHR